MALGLVRNLATKTFCRRMSLGIPGLDCSVDSTPVNHTPIFSERILKLFEDYDKKSGLELVLDMTFGNGGHSRLMLDHFQETTVIGSDCDPEAFGSARHLCKNYRNDDPERRLGRFMPLKSRFSDLSRNLSEADIAAGSLDGVIIDMGLADFQWHDKSRGFCHMRKGKLDLRFDPSSELNLPTASEILQLADEHSLTKMLKAYGGLKRNAKHVSSAIMEARYLFHKFQTVEELYVVLQTAAKNITGRPNCEPDHKLVQDILADTILALRMCINDEINELDFAIHNVAMDFLRPGGILVVLVDSNAGKKLMKQCLHQINLPKDANTDESLGYEAVSSICRSKAWNLIHQKEPWSLTEAEKVMHPRLQNAVMFAAYRAEND